jgi:hypothetical protein
MSFTSIRSKALLYTTIALFWKSIKMKWTS